MRLVRRIVLINLVALMQFARADMASDLAAAARPLEDGVPEVAVARLQDLLNKDLSPQNWRAVAEKLGEAQVAARQNEAALNLLADTRLRDSVLAKFWRAQALAHLRRWAEALPFYAAVARDDRGLRAQALFGEAEALRALSRDEDAVQKLSALFQDQQFAVLARLRAAEILLDKGDGPGANRLLDKLQAKKTVDRKVKQLLRARVEMVMHRPERAIPAFESILKKTQSTPHAVLTAALFGLADAHLQLKTPDLADDTLEDFIEHHPSDVDLAKIFAKLDELYRAERKSSRTELERWVRDPEQPRRGLARWYLARLDLRAGHRERALQLLSDLSRERTKSPMLAPALLEFAKLQMDDRHYDEAIAILREASLLHPDQTIRDRIELLAAQANYLAKHFDIATKAFEQLAHSNSPLAKLSLFNASVGWLQMGDRPRFAANYAEFEKLGGDEQSRAELRLEEGLVLAAKGDQQAAQSLQNFVRDFPQNARVSEAWVALAELAFHEAPPRLKEARKYLSRAMEAKPTAAAAQRGEYLAIWIEDSIQGNDAKVIELANRFLQQHESSPFSSDVRMKLAETYYRRQDFPAAQTQFETLTQQDPNNPLAEKALFFAAESGISSMGANSLDRALVLFDQVVRSNGELKWAARNEQAVIERKLGKAQDAISLYDEVLKGNARPVEKREALCGKGDIFFEMGGNDNYRRAIELYDQLASEKDAPIHWRNQAIFKKGLCLEKSTDRVGALATFYKVLEDEARPDRPRELFWFYKAGFNAARLLEDDFKWESAAAIYQKLAAAGGSRSEEAKARLNRLRLEHFLWSD